MIATAEDLRLSLLTRFGTPGGSRKTGCRVPVLGTQGTELESALDSI
jgi:hypothetical protein